jgi:hypothetical protein
MTGVVRKPTDQRFDGDVPKTLQGIVETPLYMAQCVDPDGVRHVIMLVKAGDRIFTFPLNFWKDMGVLPEWLEKQVRAMIFPEESKPKEKADASSTPDLDFSVNVDVPVGAP